MLPQVGMGYMCVTLPLSVGWGGSHSKKLGTWLSQRPGALLFHVVGGYSGVLVAHVLATCRLHLMAEGTAAGVGVAGALATC